MPFKEMIQSKKFVMTAIGILAVCLVAIFGKVDDALIAAIAGLISAYCLGQGIADNGANKGKDQPVE